MLIYQTYALLRTFFWIMKVASCYIFSPSRVLNANIRIYLKESLFLGRGSVNMLICGVVPAVRVVKNHSNFVFIVCFCIHNHLFSLHLRFYALLNLKLIWEYTLFTVFQTVFQTVFVLISRPVLKKWSWRTSLNMFLWNVVFICGNYFAVSSIVFEKNYVKVWLRSRKNFKVDAAVAVPVLLKVPNMP